MRRRLSVWPSNLRQLLIGRRKVANVESGSQAWQEIFNEHENRDTFACALDVIQDEYVRVLTEAATATSPGSSERSADTKATCYLRGEATADRGQGQLRGG